MTNEQRIEKLNKLNDAYERELIRARKTNHDLSVQIDKVIEERNEFERLLQQMILDNQRVRKQQHLKRMAAIKPFETSVDGALH